MQESFQSPVLLFPHLSTSATLRLRSPGAKPLVINRPSQHIRGGGGGSMQESFQSPVLLFPHLSTSATLRLRSPGAKPLVINRPSQHIRGGGGGRSHSQ